MPSAAAIEDTRPCGCGANLDSGEYGPVCTCSCVDELKPRTIAQEIHDLVVHRNEIDRRIQELIEARLREIAA